MKISGSLIVRAVTALTMVLGGCTAGQSAGTTTTGTAPGDPAVASTTLSNTTQSATGSTDGTTATQAPSTTSVTTQPSTTTTSLGVVDSVAVLSAAAPLSFAASRLASATDGAKFFGAGGLNEARVSTDRIISFDPSTGENATVGRLKRGVHDAAAVWAGGRLVVLGGGADTAEDLIQTWSPGTDGAISGHLPGPRADLGAAVDGDVIYVVGGAHGTTMDLEVLAVDATTLKSHTVAILAKGNRYGSVVVLDHVIYLLGGEVVDGVPLADVVKIDPATGSVSDLAPLPMPLSHAGLAPAKGGVVIAGGRNSDGYSSAIVSWSPASGAVVLHQRLPNSASDVGVVTIGNVVVAVGGERDHVSMSGISLLKFL